MQEVQKEKQGEGRKEGSKVNLLMIHHNFTSGGTFTHKKARQMSQYVWLNEMIECNIYIFIVGDDETRERRSSTSYRLS